MEYAKEHLQTTIWFWGNFEAQGNSNVNQSS